MNQKTTPSARETAFWRAAILCVAMLFPALSVQAQFTGDYQTNIINGTTVNWAGSYRVGSNYVGDALFILNGGSLSNEWGYIGSQHGANGNLAVVSGSGSVWTNFGRFYVGDSGSANRLVISDGGKVMAFGDIASANSSGSVSNSILVTGSGSVFTGGAGLYVGDAGAFCGLVVSNGGAVFCRYAGHVGGSGGLGGGAGGQSNIALVTGSGSVWRCAQDMNVGNYGSGNTDRFKWGRSV